MSGALIVGLVAAVIAAFLIADKMRPGKEFICAKCGWHGTPKKGLNGNAGVELLLWVLFIVPGMIYTAYRAKNRPSICRSCGSTDMIPVDSPRGRELLSHYREGEQSTS